MFKFELSWLIREDFHGIVAKIWQEENKGRTPLERWQNKIRRLRQYLRGWAKNQNGAYKKEKKELTDRLDQLDKKAETTVLQQHEVDLKHCLKERLGVLLRQEEIKWHQRSKTNHLLKGDSNTKYFQLVANGKRRKTRIFQLEDGSRIIKGDEQLKEYITHYYKGLFGPNECEDATMNEDRRDDITQISAEDNEKLIAQFCEKEVKDAIFQMKHSKAPGLDGFPVEFY
jgi:hypothetical protein